MRGKNGTNENAMTTRPYASEAEIRAMYDNAAAHSARAVQHENAAAKLVQDAENATGRWVSDAQEKAAQYVQQAQETAAELVRQAKEQADEDVRKAQEAAAAEIQAAEGQAAMIRADRDAEVKKERYWAGLADDEAGRADLPTLAETLTDGQLGTGEVAQP
jgi:vacuolar-type H+-ATPase subunit H